MVVQDSQCDSPVATLDTGPVVCERGKTERGARTEMFYYVTMKTGVEWSGQDCGPVLFLVRARQGRRDQGRYVGLT